MRGQQVKATSCSSWMRKLAVHHAGCPFIPQSKPLLRSGEPTRAYSFWFSMHLGEASATSSCQWAVNRSQMCPSELKYLKKYVPFPPFLFHLLPSGYKRRKIYGLAEPQDEKSLDPWFTVWAQKKDTFNQKDIYWSLKWIRNKLVFS